ncbi:MAG: hypothetical protein IPM83_15765 [Ignavibacteria bacterium]|nr:hypothetical protein [Ignavibacteria bacterium]
MQIPLFSIVTSTGMDANSNLLGKVQQSSFSNSSHEIRKLQCEIGILCGVLATRAASTSRIDFRGPFFSPINVVMEIGA